MKRSILFLLLFFVLAKSAGAQCVPSQAYFSGVADDALTIWINGTQLNTSSMPITYIDWTSTTTSPVYTFPVGILNTSGPNTIDVENVNTSASIVLSAWWLDIVCADGNQTYLTNDDGGYKMYDDTSGTHPPPTYGGYQWYQSGWVDATGLFSGTPQLVSTSYGDGNGYTMKNLWNPATGAILSPISWDNTGIDHTASEDIYYTKTFTLTDINYPPTAFTLTKTANPSSGLTYAQAVTYTLKICNSGAPISGPVTLVDTHDPHLALAAWPNSSIYGGSFPFSYSGGSPLTIIYKTGFGGYGACDTVTYALYAEGTNCEVMDNAVTLNTLTTEGTPVTANASYAVTMNCPSTPTNTNTKTVTSTATNSPTLTSTSTVTLTHTPTMTATLAATNTSTSSPSATATGTPTFTITNTLTATHTSTSSPTATATGTPTFTMTATMPATNTDTPTSTLTLGSTATNTFSSTQTASWTATGTQTSTGTPTMTATGPPPDTSTATETGTASATPTSTLTNTATLIDTATATYSSTSTATLADTATMTFTPTSTATLVDTATMTFTTTSTATLTDSATSTATLASTATMTWTPTGTATPANTATGTTTQTSTSTRVNTATPTSSETPVFTPTHTPITGNNFFIGKNVFHPPSDELPINVTVRDAPGNYGLYIFNSAGEHIKTLDEKSLTGPYSNSYMWDGTNKYGGHCASGVYIIYLVEPLKTVKARVVLIH